MRRYIVAFLLVVRVVGPDSHAQHKLWISPDVPTDPDGPPIYLPWQVVQHRHNAPTPYMLEFGVLGSPAIDALEKMDLADNWLFSVAAPNDLAGALGGNAEPRDVIRRDAVGALTPFFDGSCVAGIVPIHSSIDALYLDGGDSGDLIISFDVPTTIGATTFLPSELVRYTPSGSRPCGWVLVGSEIDFRATLATYSPSAGNVTGADRIGNEWVLAFSIPEDLGPPGVTTFTPGELVTTNGAAVTPLPFDDLQAEGAPGWPTSSLIDALACQANPGSIYDDPTLPVGLIIGKAAAPVGDIVLSWSGGSCSSGGDDFGVYEGSLAAVRAGSYDHVSRACIDSAPQLEEQVTPSAGDAYYMVVPRNDKVEGSYGFDSVGSQRPQPTLAADRCVAMRVVTDCP